jgi:hypothetical protein
MPCRRVNVVDERCAAQPWADEPPAGHNRAHRKRQVTTRVGFQHVAAGSRGERRFSDLPGSVLADEEDIGVRVVVENAACRVDAADLWKPDVEEDQIGFEVAGFLYSVQPIRGFIQNLPWVGIERCAQITTPRFEIVDKK